IAISIGELEIPEGVVVALYRNSTVVDSQLFLRRSVVVYQHFLRTNDGSTADLVGVKPAHMNEGDNIVREVQRQERNIFDSLAVVTLALAAYRLGHPIQQR